MRLYLSGPMTGLPEHNFKAFQEYATKLRTEGHTVIDPSENDAGHVRQDRKYYLKTDILHLLTSDLDAVCVMPGWKDSKGATLEVMIAKEMEIPILDIKTMKPWHESILDEAQRIVSGSRRGDYGSALSDYTKVAKLWNVFLQDYLRKPLTPYVCCLCMLGIKLSREINKHKRDNLVDICGYTQCLDSILEDLQKAEERWLPQGLEYWVNQTGEYDANNDKEEESVSC